MAFISVLCSPIQPHQEQILEFKLSVDKLINFSEYFASAILMAPKSEAHEKNFNSIDKSNNESHERYDASSNIGLSAEFDNKVEYM